ncbi:MAG: hypothetical protein AAGN35_05530 [Bacteroidota bacterium]
MIDDWLFGEDTEAIEAVFREEKDIFLAKTNGILGKIAQRIADELNEALNIIEFGRKENERIYRGLSDADKRLAQESYEGFKDQYLEREDTVYDKQKELASDLARSSKDNADSLRETFDKINEVAAGWIGKAFAALMWVINKIIEISEAV